MDYLSLFLLDNLPVFNQRYYVNYQENPRMTVYHFVTGIFHLKVPESSHVGSAIGRIRAVDPDFGKNAEIEYNIVPGDGGNLFDITTDENTQEGVIKLKKVCGTNGLYVPMAQMRN